MPTGTGTVPQGALVHRLLIEQAANGIEYLKAELAKAEPETCEHLEPALAAWEEVHAAHKEAFGDRYPDQQPVPSAVAREWATVKFLTRSLLKRQRSRP